jgi:hypothetical protein
MSCINKADKAYKSLQNVYGDTLAEAFVRGYPTNKGRSEDTTFDIPSRTEVKEWLTEQKKNIPKYLKRAMEINPYMSETAIKSMLKGVISKYEDAYFVTTGWLFSGSTVMNAEVLETIYKPNIRIMEAMHELYPDIFTLRGTKTTNRVLVEITPRVKPLADETAEDLEEELPTEEEPSIAESLRTYQSIVEANNGRKPVEFIAGNLKWQLNNKGLYNSVDKFTNDVYIRDMDLETGEMIPEIDPGVPVNEAKRDRIFRAVMQMIREQSFDEYLAVKGIDTTDIYESLRDAKTEGELNKVLETLLKAIC